MCNPTSGNTRERDGDELLTPRTGEHTQKKTKSGPTVTPPPSQPLQDMQIEPAPVPQPPQSAGSSSSNPAPVPAPPQKAAQASTSEYKKTYKTHGTAKSIFRMVPNHDNKKSYSLQRLSGGKWEIIKTEGFEFVKVDDIGDYSIKKGQAIGQAQYYKDERFSKSGKYLEPPNRRSSLKPLTAKDKKCVSLYGIWEGALSHIFAEVSSGEGGNLGMQRSDGPGDYRWYGTEALGYALGLRMDWYKGEIIRGKTKRGSLQQTDSYESRKNRYRSNLPLNLAEEETPTTVPQGTEILYYKSAARIRDTKKSGKEHYSDSPDRPSPPAIPDRKRIVVLTSSGDTSIVRSYKRAIAELYRKKKKAVDISKGASSIRDPNLAGIMQEFLLEQATKSKTGTPLRKGDLPQGASKYLEAQLQKTEVKKQWDSFYNASSNYSLSTSVNPLPAGPKPKEISGLALNKLDASGSPKVTVGQEWCHLQGHGDGGAEEAGNIICGSHYANTEQLAIESGLRKARNRCNAVTNRVLALSARITAYRMPNDPLLAHWIRYKIYILPSTEHTDAGAHKAHKVFDHVFDAQSESFDQNEFKILETTVTRTIAVAATEKEKGKAAAPSTTTHVSALTDYELRIAAKIEKRFESEPVTAMTTNDSSSKGKQTVPQCPYKYIYNPVHTI